MSRAPSETTCGTPAAPAASRRSGPAESTPPTSSSASSVVVTSSTPATKPPVTSASIDWPPAPVEADDDALRPLAHRCDSGAPVAGRGQRCYIRPGSAGDLGARDVGLEAGRLVNSRVDHRHVDAVVEQSLPEECVLVALRV